MRDIAAYQGDLVTRLALRFMALTFTRMTEMINAEWDEFDERAAEWRIPPDRMKMRDPHIVPLSRQALDTLAALRELNSAHRYVFYSVQGRSHISNNTMLYALYRMGYKSRMTGHGFRAGRYRVARARLQPGRGRSAACPRRAQSGHRCVRARRIPARAPKDDAALGRSPRRIGGWRFGHPNQRWAIARLRRRGANMPEDMNARCATSRQPGFAKCVQYLV